MLALILSGLSYSQSQGIDPRWRLVKDGAIVPVKDLIVIASYRLYLEDMKDSYKQESIERGKEALNLRQALKASGKEIDLLNEGIERARGELAIMDEQLDECQKKRDGLKAWATIGKTFVIVGSVCLVGVVAVNVINSAK
jgi:hypothetical protein